MSKNGRSLLDLRECLICGHVGCCDSSKNKHATKDFYTINYQIVQSIEPGEEWCWCYNSVARTGYLLAIACQKMRVLELPQT